MKKSKLIICLCIALGVIAHAALSIGHRVYETHSRREVYSFTRDELITALCEYLILHEGMTMPSRDQISVSVNDRYPLYDGERLPTATLRVDGWPSSEEADHAGSQ